MKTSSSSRRKKVALPPPPEPTLIGSGLSFVKELCQHNISQPIAFAFILFAATSVGAVAVAYPALSQYSNPVAMQTIVRDRVLGASTTRASLLMRSHIQTVKEKAQPVVNNASVLITAQPASYDQATDKWSYIISWNRKLSGGTGSISINGVLVADNTTGTGQVTTDFLYGPDTKYRLNFYNQPALGGIRISSRDFTTLDTPDVSETGTALTPGPDSGNTPLSILPPPMTGSTTMTGQMHLEQANPPPHQ